MYEIEDGIEIPRPRAATIEPLPLDDLRPGQSFVIPCDDGEVNSRRSTVFARAKRRGIRIATRKCDDGLRVWRIE